MSIFFTPRKSVEILGEKLGVAAFGLFRIKNATTFFFTYFLKFATKEIFHF
jgi:hypothetical protein